MTATADMGVATVEQQPPPYAAWELELRARLLAGEEAALKELYDQFSPMVYGLALRVTGDRTAAEDITQDVFVHVWERPWSFDPSRGRLRGWLATIAHHRAIDRLRRVKVRRRYAAVEGGQQPPPPSPEEAAVAAAVATRVRAAIRDLPAPQQAAVVLAYFEGKTFRQVAEITGVPEGTAKSRLRLGLRRVADRLRSEGITADW
ncbi:MAG TPA: sigma-70 family RNA polymerase sigma factor [Actinomycetota bacterium]|jgi:RNA polymerase sigma-70 factor (ECF subfamily)|nr:sigma-70 family RNA polymerase sigma factor [Actinomycetota bacterium]